MTADEYLGKGVATWASLRKFRHAWDGHGPDVDLPPYRGIDPLHPMIQAFIGDVTDLAAWTKLTIERADYYHQVRDQLVKDPGPGIYIYILQHDNETNYKDHLSEDVYIGVTRNPYLRFAQHRRRPWWPRVNSANISLIDCRWHDGPPCSTNELDLAALRLEGWLIELFEPSENRALGPVT